MLNYLLKMPEKVSENIKDIPDSHLVFGKKRITQIREFAQTKFGDSLIIVKPNREEERFEVIVKDNVKLTDVNDFEKLWTMCKVLKAK